MKKVIYFIAVVMFVSIVKAQSGENDDAQNSRMRPVLIVIDIQNQFKDYIPERDRQIGIYMINASIELFRRYGYPVIRVYHSDPQWGPKPGSPEFQFFDGVMVDSSDVMVIKNYPSSFKKTELDKILKGMNRNTVFLCGLSAVGCVISTHFAAKDLDYKSFMIKDAIMSHVTKYTDSIEEMFDAVGYEAMEAMLENAEK